MATISAVSQRKSGGQSLELVPAAELEISDVEMGAMLAPAPALPAAPATSELRWSDVFRGHSYLLLSFVVMILWLPPVLFELLSTPRQRYFSQPNGVYPGDATITYPMQDETVPTWGAGVFVALALFGIVAAEILQAPLLHATRRHAARAAVAIAVEFAIVNFITYAATTCIKMAVGRPRPDFFARLATGDAGIIHQGQLSYPSGHSSTSFATGVFWALYFTWCFHFRGGHAAREHCACGWKNDLRAFAHLVVIGAGPAVAAFIAVSRVVDYRHHPADINAGCILGTMCTAFLWVRVLPIMRECRYS